MDLMDLEEEPKPMTGGWRLSRPYTESKQSAFVKQMVEELQAIPRIKREVPTHWNGKLIADLSSEEREEFYFSQQPESTKQALLRQKTRKPSEDIDYLLRPMPDCVANPDAKSLDELTAKRQLDPSDMLLHNQAAQGRNQRGQSVASSVSEEKREKGIHAFTYSKPANLSDTDIKRIAKLTQVDAIVAAAPASKEEPVGKLPWITRVSDWVSAKLPDWFWDL